MLLAKRRDVLDMMFLNVLNIKQILPTYSVKNLRKPFRRTVLNAMGDPIARLGQMYKDHRATIDLYYLFAVKNQAHNVVTFLRLSTNFFLCFCLVLNNNNICYCKYLIWSHNVYTFLF